MNWEINGALGFATLDFVLEADECVFAQPRSMVCMTTGIAVTSEWGGYGGSNKVTGAIKGLLAGESVAIAVFSAKSPGQKLSLAPDAIGPIIPIVLAEAGNLMIAKGSYLAHGADVTLNAKFSGFKGMLAKKGIFLLEASGAGTVFLTAAGEIRSVVLAPEEKFVIDNDFVVAFEQTVSFELVTASKGVSDSILSGEGLVNRYTGPGRVYFQSRAKARPGFFSTMMNTVT